MADKRLMKAWTRQEEVRILPPGYASNQDSSLNLDAYAVGYRVPTLQD